MNMSELNEVRPTQRIIPTSRDRRRHEEKKPAKQDKESIAERQKHHIDDKNKVDEYI